MAIEHRPLTERDYALAGPISLKEPGSPGWLYQKLYLLERNYPRVHELHAEMQRLIEEVESYKPWEVIPTDKPYGSADAMYRATVGVSRDDLLGMISAARERSRRAAEMTHEADIRREGRPGNEETMQFAQFPAQDRASNAGISLRTQRKLDRLARDYPVLHERVKAGELSVNAAAIEAGFVAPTFSAPLDPNELARALARRLPPADLATLIRALVALAGE